MTTIQTLKSKAAEASTATLMGALYMLDAKTSKDEAERLAYAAICETVEEREGLDAIVGAIFDNTDDLFTGTYAEALTIALVVAA